MVYAGQNRHMDSRIVKNLARISLVILTPFLLAAWPSVNLSGGVSGSPSRDPVASYNFNDGGATIVDRTGNGHDGTCSTCPIWNATEGRNGDGAYLYSLNNQQVITFDVSTIDMHSNNAFTIAYDIFISIPDNFTGTIISWLGISVFKDGVLSNPKYSINNAGVSGSLIITSTNAEFGAWHNVAQVFNGAAGTWTLYVDSVLSVQNTGITGALTETAFDLTIGEAGEFGGLNGWVDNVRIYNVALEVSEIEAIDGVDVPD